MSAPSIPEWLSATGSGVDVWSPSTQPVNPVIKPTIPSPPPSAPWTPPVIPPVPQIITTSNPQPLPPAPPVPPPPVYSRQITPPSPTMITQPLPPAPPPPAFQPSLASAPTPPFPPAPQAPLTASPMKVEVVSPLPATPYQQQAPAALKIPTVAPIGAALGGNVLAVKKDTGPVVNIIVKSVVVMLFLALLTGIVYLFISGTIHLPALPLIEELESAFNNGEWVIPVSLLSVGGTFIAFGYLLQKSAHL